MIRVSSISVPLDFCFTDSSLRELCVKKLGIPAKSLRSVKLSRKAVDARRKSDVHFTLSLDITAEGEGKLLKRLKNAAPVSPEVYTVPELKKTPEHCPVIVGFGPGGMFAALVLAMAGVRPVVLERGYDVDSRVKAVEEFQNGGKLDPRCNVQFGEGGAGTFSDGKLTTGIRDRRIGWILKQLVSFGAPDEILYLAKPHIGTDRLRSCVKALRERVIALGGEVHFGAQFCGYETGDKGQLTAVSFTDGQGLRTLPADRVILATGHSARDVFTLLHQRGVELMQKSFSVGVRIEHLRTDIDRAMYGSAAGHPALKAADYKLAVHLPNGRSLYTFCMCPGGEVVAAASEEGRLAVNGMSCFARDAVNSNSALLVGISPADFGSAHPLAGMYLQRELEEKAFIAGGGDYSAPVTTVGGLLSGTVPDSFGRVKPSYRPGVRFAPPEDYLPGYVCDSLRLGLAELGRKIRGFDDPEAVLTGIESRSSSPVRIVRDQSLQSVSVPGLYPCGEGAGFAGGIVSAAVDGMKCAEAVLAEYSRKQA